MTTPPNTPDRYELYSKAVQSPDLEARFLRALHTAPKDQPLILGEDFSAAGALSRAWTNIHPSATAICIDIDPEPLERLKDAPRITTRCADVSEPHDPADIICALNFAVCELHTRPRLLAYLKHARARLNPDGIYVADLYAGPDAFALGTSEQELRSGVLYTWEQREADPLTARVTNAIHFRTPAGEELRDAFVYNWRLWSIPELRDAMTEAGFATTEAHDRLGQALDADGNLHTAPVTSPEDLDENFVAHIVARTTA